MNKIFIFKNPGMWTIKLYGIVKKNPKHYNIALSSQSIISGMSLDKVVMVTSVHLSV